MVTFIPYVTGYYEDRITITELSLQSAIKGALGREMDILIFDQGSCPEWRGRLSSFLDLEYVTSVYFSGYNIGKRSALHKIMRMVDSEIISYTDDDVLFYPGWLDEAVTLLDEFPADLVTGSPILTRFKWYEKQLERFKNDNTITVEELSWEDYPKDWLKDDALGRGLPRTKYIRLITKAKVRPVQVLRGGRKAWAVGHHMQFTAIRDAICPYFSISGRELMGGDTERDVAMDAGGLSQLATLERTTRHMGSTLDDSIVNDAINMELVI